MGTARGVQINRMICNQFHALDSSRYTTNAVNGMLALGPKMGTVIQEIMRNVQMAEEPGENHKEGHKEEGASALNSMMALMIGPMADVFACHPLMTECIEEACQGMDITGLNYLTGRHGLEKEVTVSVEGAGTLQGFGNADPRAIGSYDDTTWKTYNGYVMAVVRSGVQAGEIKVKFEAKGCESQEIVIHTA